MQSWWAKRVSRIVWIKVAALEYKIAPCLDLNGKRPGNWDIERRYVFERSVKYRSIVQRFAKGFSWEDTDLFRDVYTRRFKTDNEIRGTSSIKELAEQYYLRIDALYESMSRDGFLTESQGKALDLPGFLIGRGGEYFIGNQGNHRLAIAKVIGLEKIAGRIVCRHI